MRYKSLANLVYQNQLVPTSGNDIRAICDGKINIINYSDLQLIYNSGGSIYDLFQPELNNCVGLLYQLKGQNVGHWVCLIYDAGSDTSESANGTAGTIRFFNSYGFGPDQEIDLFQHPQPYLTMLLNKSHSKIDVNKFKFQSLKNDISTCGLHCGVRCVFHELSNKDYLKFLSSYDNDRTKNYDKLVTLMCLLPLDYNITRSPQG